MPKKIPASTRRMVEDLHRTFRLTADEISDVWPNIPNTGELPAKRTIERWIAALIDDSRQWTWQDADPEECALVLSVLAEVMDFTEGRVTSFTVREAKRITHLMNAFEGMKEVNAYILAMAMNDETGVGPSPDDVTGYLVYQPWTSKQNQMRYQAAIDQGWIPDEPPLALQLNEDGTIDLIRIRAFFDQLIESQRDQSVPPPGRTTWRMDS